MAINVLKIKMSICKLITCWIYPKKNKKFIREFLYWFSYSDYIRFKHANYNVVSLGSSCVTRALAVATGIKPRRFYGEKSGPFDLYISSLQRTIELIENDFEDFFKDINIDAFPHDEDFNFLHFKKRYSKRIQNFLDWQNSDKKIYYIYSNYSEIPKEKDIVKLYNVLKEKRKGKPFELIVLVQKHIDVPNIIQIPYEINSKENSGIAVQSIINRYKTFHNNYSKLSDYMKEKLRKIVI